MQARALVHFNVEAAALLDRIGQFAKGVREFNPAGVIFEPFGHARVMGARTRQRGLAGGVFDQRRRPAKSEMGLDPRHQQLAENIRPAVVGRGREAGPIRRRAQGGGVRGPIRRQRLIKVDARVPAEGLPHGQNLGGREGVGPPVAKPQACRPGGAGGLGDQPAAIGDEIEIGRPGPVPFQHREFGVVQGPALAVAEHAGEGENPLLPRRQQLLAGEFRRRMQVKPARRAIWPDKVRPESGDMGLVAGRDLQNGGLDLDEVPRGEARPPAGHHSRPRQQGGPPVLVDAPAPPGRGRRAGILRGTSCHSCPALRYGRRIARRKFSRAA